jgi:hypothetical protein
LAEISGIPGSTAYRTNDHPRLRDPRGMAQDRTTTAIFVSDYL